MQACPEKSQSWEQNCQWEAWPSPSRSAWTTFAMIFIGTSGGTFALSCVILEIWVKGKDMRLSKMSIASSLDIDLVREKVFFLNLWRTLALFLPATLRGSDIWFKSDYISDYQTIRLSDYQLSDCIILSGDMGSKVKLSRNRFRRTLHYSNL